VDQLKTESASGGAANTNYSNAFSYDGMGNRTRAENVSGGNTRVTSSTPNELNQLSSLSQNVNGAPATTSGFGYDLAGNTTLIESADGGKMLFTYDDADRLVQVERQSAAGVPLGKSEFLYDYASRKAVSKEFTWTNGAWNKDSEKRRVFDGLDVVQERNAANQVTAQLVRDGNIGGILARSTGAGKTFFGYDGGGNVTLLTDENGDDVGRYRYDAFGNTLEVSGARAVENPYRFSTKEYDGASGLYDFGFRFYSPGLGRWINRDPLSEAGGVNLYAMVGNDPINDWDEYGLKRAGAKALKALTPEARASFNKLGIPSANIFKSRDSKKTRLSGSTHVARFGKANTLDISPDYGLSKKKAFEQLTPWLEELRDAGWAAWIRGDDSDETDYEPHIHAVYMGSYNKNNSWQVKGYKRGENALHGQDRKDTTNPISLSKKKKVPCPKRGSIWDMLKKLH